MPDIDPSIPAEPTMAAYTGTTKPKKTVHDWTRGMQLSAEVNKSTVGVETTEVTPELLLQTTKKLLDISRGEAEPDQKDSLLYQRFYGPAEYFAEHVLRDAGQLGRGLLWKATNRGNVDFMQPAALDKHISSVFYDSKLAQLADASSPLEQMDAAYKTTRIGEGGVADLRMAPDEMRLVQPSYYGFIDSIRSPERLRVGLDMYFAKHCRKGSDGKLYTNMINAKTGKEELVDSVTAAKSIVAAPDMLDADTDSVYAINGSYGCRIVPKKDVQYYLPRADEAYSVGANMVTMMSGVKDMRLLMGCLHPDTTMVTIGKDNLLSIKPVTRVKTANCVSLIGSTGTGAAERYKLRMTVSKFVSSKTFKKIVLRSGRALITSPDHRWPVLINGKQELRKAEDLQPGDIALRTSWCNLPERRGFLRGAWLTADIAYLLGVITRNMSLTTTGALLIKYSKAGKSMIKSALDKMAIKYRSYKCSPKDTLLIDDMEATAELIKLCGGLQLDQRRIPDIVLSGREVIAAAFIDGYTADDNLVGIDCVQDIWILQIPNIVVRDGLALLLARTGMDCLYRDAVRKDIMHLALKIVPMEKTHGDMIEDEILQVLDIKAPGIMIDVDADDNLYCTANGVLTHNSKYPMQAISLDHREAPLVQSLDEASGKTMSEIVGKYLGARYAKKDGYVKAVRKDRIDMIYDDGTEGSVDMYRDFPMEAEDQVGMYNNFPMNAKGFISNTPQVKAGMRVKAGDVLASSNYTDDKGTAAIGTNLRSAWISWKGGTYEDAIVVSESAAKNKLRSTVMYKTGLDLDKSIKTGKQLYMTWKPGTLKNEQLEHIDDTGVVKPGTVLQPGDPMILAVQVNAPAPGTMGKRVLTDVSQTWEHSQPGVVTDVVQSRNGVRVYATVSAPAQVGDKLSNLYGAKGVISAVLPDDEMPQDAKGNAIEVCFAPLGLITRTNPGQLHEALLGKVAAKTGRRIVVPQFMKGSRTDFVDALLKQNHLSATEDLIDPSTGKKIPAVFTGVSYIHKLKHLADSKLAARGTDMYTADEQPAAGSYSGSKRYGGLEIGALVGHNAFDVIEDAHVVRGQTNSEFWRSLRTGEIPTVPGEPLVNKKFFAHLRGAGVNIRRTPKGISVFSLSNSDVDELAGPRELKSTDTYEQKTFKPIDGGLFGTDIFGENGDRWAYIQLDEPLPNPVMEEPLARLLRMSVKQFQAVVAGKEKVNGLSSASDIQKVLAKLNMNAEKSQALKELKDAPNSRKDAALKRYRVVARIANSGVQPSEYMLNKIPVLPPMFRPVTTHGDLTMVADSNYLYAQMLDARNDLRDAANLPDEYKQAATENLYRAWKELAGLYSPEDPKLQNKNVGGLLRWALGTSPKMSAFQRKLIGAPVDTVGRGTATPDARLKLNEIGLPERMAFDIFAPLITRKLALANVPVADAMKMVKERHPQARQALLELMENRPVQMNRAPTLHKLNIMGFRPRLVPGDAIHVNPSIVTPFCLDFDGDAVNIHAPVSDKAVRNTYERMMPERNLVSMAKREILYKPEKEYIHGLWLATAMKESKNKKPLVFDTLEDARAAYRSGSIDVNDPIEIKYPTKSNTQGAR